MEDKEINKLTGADIDNDDDGLFTLRLEDGSKNVYIGSFSVIGRRHKQQDAIKTDTYYTYIEKGKAIAVLCDGMGGLNGGEKASALCSEIVHSNFHNDAEFNSIPEFYRAAIWQADEKISTMRNERNEKLCAGTTLVSVVVDGDKLFWASVGDSRIYIIRRGKILCITQDHNYLMILNEKVKNGEISQNEADSHPKKEALISYIGMGGVKYIDMNVKAFELLDGDDIVLCSDGLYRTVSEEEIVQIVLSFGNDPQQAAEALTVLALSKKRRDQDNTSAVVINYRGSM